MYFKSWGINLLFFCCRTYDTLWNKLWLQRSQISDWLLLSIATTLLKIQLSWHVLMTSQILSKLWRNGWMNPRHLVVGYVTSVFMYTYWLLHGLNLYFPDISTRDPVFPETWRDEGEISGNYISKPYYNLFISCLPAIIFNEKKSF